MDDIPEIPRLRGAGLEPSQAEFGAVFEDAAIGIAVVDLEGRLVQCNPALARILGYAEAELSGMAFPEVTHPDDVQADVELYRSLIAGERDHYQIEKRYIRKDGQIVWARLFVSLAHGHSRPPKFCIAMVEDITAQKLAEDRLRESEEKFFKAFHGNPHPTVIFRRADGFIREANEAFGAWFGMAAREVRGKTAFDFGLWKSTRDRDELLKLLDEKGSLRNYEMRVKLPTGERRDALLSIQPISIRGEECLLTISTDVTQQKQAQDRELRSHEEFSRRLLGAQEQERQRLGAELHDSLGQNLSIIINNVVLALRQPGLPADAAQYLNAISVVASDSIGELRDLVRNLHPLQIEQLGLTDSLRELAERVLKSTPMQIELRIENVDDVIKGAAATHLYRIVQEALNNLIKHSRASHATLRLERDIKCVRLRLLDDGQGFDVQPALQSGFGLRNLAERTQLLGGTLNLASAPGAGTQLSIELPIASDDEAADA